MEPYSFDIKVEKEDLRRFNLYVHFHRVLGPVLVLAGIAIIFAGLFTTNTTQDRIVIPLIGLLVLVYPVLSLWIRASMAMERNPVFSEPLHYSLEDEGIRMHTDVDLGFGNDRESKLRWENVYKVCETKTMLMVFSNNINAFLMPKKDLGDKVGKIKEIISDKVDDHRLELKK